MYTFNQACAHMALYGLVYILQLAINKKNLEIAFIGVPAWEGGRG